jgi:hypothetical protein
LFLHVTISDASKSFPGMSPATIRQGLLAEVANGASEIPKLGDAATFKSDDPSRAEATAYVKGSILKVTFESRSARAQKDTVIALL